MLPIAYVSEALIVGAFGSTDLANERYQFVWLETDMTPVACLVTPAVRAAATYAGHAWPGGRTAPEPVAPCIDG